MAEKAVDDNFTFVGGLHTEGSYFLTPKDSWKEGDNIVPSIDGSIARRKGIDYESGYQLAALSPADFATIQGQAYVMKTWANVGGDGNLDFFVIQTGTTLHFYEALGGVTSSRKKGFTVNLSSFQAAGNTDVVANFPIDVVSCFGQLIVTGRSIDPIAITYDAVNDTIATKRLDLKIRDFTGLYMTSDIQEERTQAGWGNEYPAAIYNLYNQGWTATQISAYQTANANKLPSNTKSWIFGKDSNDDFQAALLNKQDFGTSPAPRGRFVLSAFNQDRAAVAAIGGITTDSATVPGYQDKRPVTGDPVGASATSIFTNYNSFRPASCAFFAGRAWYSGVREGVQSTWVLFSGVATDSEKLEECYQTNDPTAEVLSDIEDDDGGVITIPDAGEILAVRAAGNALLVFATGGVWSIIGGDNGFSATQYSVEKITGVGCISRDALVQVEDVWVYWSINGIYGVKIDQTGLGQVENLTDEKIKTLYRSIAPSKKSFAVGTYDNDAKIVYWLYSNDDVGNTQPYLKNKMLAYDLRLKAWYTLSFGMSASTPYIVGVDTTSETILSGQTVNVVVDNDNVLVDADQVVTDIPVSNNGLPVLKFATLVPIGSGNYSFTFSDLLNTRDDNTRFADWYTQLTNVSAEQPAFILTGYSTGSNGPSRSKSATYFTAFMKKTEVAVDAQGQENFQSGITLQTRWDFTDNSNPGKWSDEIQIYRPRRPFLLSYPATLDDGYPLVVTKNKIRGRGKAVQIKLQADAGKDMQMVGWSMIFIGNSDV